ncbi:MAG: prenyltransferase [Firmicutes bacterium]|nr:prenyltransferase [Bacillota bacterium]
MLKKWWLSLRPFSFTASIIPVLLGAAIGAGQTNLNFTGLIITIIAGLCYHCVANLFNSYWDWENRYDMPNSVQVIPVLLDEKFGSKALYNFSIRVLYLSIILTILLGLLYGFLVFLIASFGLLGAYYYTAPPIAYKYRGWSLPAVFLFMGLLMPTSSYIVQTRTFSSRILWLAVPLGLLTTAILQVNELRDYHTDLKNGGLTFTIILGRKLAVLAYQIFIFLPYFLVIWFYFKGETSILSLTTLLTITIPLNLGKEARNGNFNKLDQSTAKLHTVFGLLYLLGFIFK